MRKYLLLLLFLSQTCHSKELCTDAEILQYEIALRNEVVSKLTYPRSAVIRGLEGDGLINFQIVDSEVTKKQIVQSTGNRDFDLAMETVINNSVFPQLSCNTIQPKINISTPIHFRLGPALKLDNTSE